MMRTKKILSHLLLFVLCVQAKVLSAQDVTAVIPQFGNYSFSYNQVPESLVSLGPAPTGYTFQWESSVEPTTGFTSISGATAASLGFGTVLPQTTFYRRKATDGSGTYYSNVIKLQLVSVNWENYNYIREHVVLIPGQTDWKVIDQLPIGSKMQTTSYSDGIGRDVQTVSRETATSSDPSNPAVLWGDITSFNEFDNLGREVKNYLPYTSTTQSGKYKSSAVTTQANYYSSLYSETSPFSNATFENNPLNREINVKNPGTSWAAGAGNSNAYELNDATDDVKIFTIGYLSGDIPVVSGVYAPNSLFKIISTDESGKQIIEYSNSEGQLLLKKIQLSNLFSDPYTGWICTYNVYDDFGRLRYTVEPEAVNYLRNNSWSFAGSNGTQVINELCFRYEYDEKGRTILKKTPGAVALRMIYDDRDRVVFMQDGNQAAKATPEWTANIYNELDRPIISTLYHTTKSVATLKADIAAAGDQIIVYVAAQSVSMVTHRNPLTSSDLNTSSVTTILKYDFYDDYNYPGAKSFSASFDNALAYPSGGDAIVQTARTVSMQTGSKTRVLGTSTFLNSSTYYDDNGRTIQHLEDNIKTGTDVTTMQYQWDGRLLSTNTKHTSTGTGYTAYSIVTKNLFDKIGRVTAIEKKFGSNAFKQIATYSFDDMGRLKNKRLAPGYTGTGKTEIETLNYSYNLHSQLTGINKNYALKAGGYNKTDNFFGMYLGYDNRDAVFTTGKLDGHITGVLWNTRGDDAQRRYDYTYDNAGRLTASNFTEKEKPVDTWGTLKMNVSVGNLSYDLNGNILSMLQKTVLPGNSAAQNMDNLTYTYAALSNKLRSVIDAGALGANNGKLGDFADGTNFGDDYVYDANGNLILDMNKNVTGVTGGVSTAFGTSGIKYNFLDKPEEIRILGKGVIKIVYDADGNKLQRSYTPDGGTAKVTSYINEYVFEDDELQFIAFEEGRLRVMQALNVNNGFDMLSVDGNMDLPGSKRGAYDYFITDYLGNVRMVLTEATHTGRNICTMESSRAPNEEPVFGQAGASNEVVTTRTAKPVGWGANGSAFTSMLSSAGKKVGPNVLLKVMSGDNITSKANYFYQNAVTNSSGANNLIGSVLTSLLGTISGSTATNSVLKGESVNINSTLSGNPTFSTLTAPHASNATGNLPKAYLTVLFFDERFNFIEEGSNFDRVSIAGDGLHEVNLSNIKAPKNGYAYVYVSNESSEPVYFDDIQVTHERKQIIEENHYYSYGLKIAAISSRKLGDGSEGQLKNNYLYQGDYSEFDEDIAWNDFELRNYDPQIGRWVQMDPYDEFSSPYVAMGGNPILNTDPDGGSIGSTIAGVADKGFNAVQTLQNVVIYSTKVVKKTSWFGSFVSGAGKFIKGVGTGVASAVVGTVKGVVEVVKNPIGTARALVSTAVNVIKDPKEAWNGVKRGVNDIVNTIKSGDPEAIGNLIGNAAVNLIPGSGIAKGVGVVGKLAKVSKTVNKVTRKLPCGCFVAGTTVYTDSGQKKIEEIAVGDKVWAFNDTTGQYGLKQVIHLFRFERDSVYEIKVRNEIIRATSDHPFYIEGRWLRVSELKQGDSVKSFDGSTLVIEQITIVPGRTTVYNFEVADFHTYYVADLKILVHNSGPCDFTPGKTPHSNATSGNNKFAQIGKQKHKELDSKVEQKEGWSSDRKDTGFKGTDGKMYYPDVKTPGGDYLEYKPGTNRGRSRGRSQVKKYKNAHPNPNVKFRVIYY